MKKQRLQRANSLLNDNKQQTQQKNEPGETGYFCGSTKKWNEKDKIKNMVGICK